MPACCGHGGRSLLPVSETSVGVVGPNRASSCWRKRVLTEMGFGPGARGPRGNQSGKRPGPDRRALALGGFTRNGDSPASSLGQTRRSHEGVQRQGGGHHRRGQRRVGRALADRCVQEEHESGSGRCGSGNLGENRSQPEKPPGANRAGCADRRFPGPGRRGAAGPKTLEAFGAVHLLCNNAGVGTEAAIWESTLDECGNGCWA